LHSEQQCRHPRRLEALYDVQSGGLVFNPAVVAKMAKLFQQFIPLSATLHNYQLTGREKEIRQLLTEGMPMPRVAEKIFPSYETVRGYIKKIIKNSMLPWLLRQQLRS
jgi:DNA-binding NarL/FixJ family response regulator